MVPLIMEGVPPPPVIKDPAGLILCCCCWDSATASVAAAAGVSVVLGVNWREGGGMGGNSC